MTRTEKANRIRETLEALYPDPPIPLHHADPYTLLISVLLSAQCTDARVNLVTPALFARADRPEKMARLSEAEILDEIRSCGLAPAKARAIRELSRRLVVEHGGEVPRDFAALEALPGVGHKTASVVMAQAFGEQAFPVDTHIHRLARRWGLSNGRSVEQTERDLKRTFPPETWRNLHLQMIYFGRSYCTARGHERASCPICCWAMSSARERAEQRQGLSKPVKSKKRATPRRSS